MTGLPARQVDWMDENHALRTGRMLMSLLMAGVDAKAVLDEDENYTSFIHIHLPNQGGMPAMTMELEITGRAVLDDE